MTWLRFQEPLWLLLAIPIGLALRWSAPRIRGMAKARRGWAIALRVFLSGLLVVALAGPQLRWRNEGVTTVFVLDQSDSMTSALRDQAARFISKAFQKAGSKDKVGLVVFGRQPAVEILPRSAVSFGAIRSVLDGSSSDPSSAVRLASAVFQGGTARRVVILTDGNETHGDLVEAVRAVATDGVVVDVVDLRDQEKGEEAAVLALEAPDQTRPDQPFDLRAVIEATTASEGTLTLDRDGVIVATTKVHLEPGQNAVLVQDSVTQSGFYRYRATLTADRDTDPRNNVGMTFVSSKGRMKVLVVEGPHSGPALAQAIERGGVAVDRRTLDNLPTRADQLQPYDAVFLNDVPAQAFTDAQIEVLRASCRDSGIGLAMVGGEDSFLSGGWYGTPVAEALPVDLEIRNRKTFPSTSIAIVVDASGSMSVDEDGMPKIKLAAKAAAQTVRMLSARDRLAVGGSSSGIEWVFPMGEVGDKRHATDQVNRLEVTGGGIFIRPSLNLAREVLEKEKSRVRHLLILGDGNDSTDWDTAFDTAAIMRNKKITTSVVAIGDGKDVPDLKRLAAVGGGQFFLATRAGQLPAIVTQDTAVMSRSAIIEEPFFPKLVGADDATRGLTAAPQLLAYCLTDAKPTARVSLATHKDDPLLATWQYGLGSGLAFTSDAQPKWAAQWVGWEGFSTFWSQAARSIARRGSSGRFTTRVTPGQGRATVDVKAQDLTSVPDQVTVSSPGGKAQAIELKQVGPGEYRGTFTADALGSYIVAVAEKQGGETKVATSGYSVAYPPEYRSSKVASPLLRQVVESGRGELLSLDRPEMAVRGAKDTGTTLVEIWPWLFGLALVVLPLDILVRRLTVSVFALRTTKKERVDAPILKVTGKLMAARSRAQGDFERPPAAAVPAPVAQPTRPTTPKAPKVEAEADGLSAAERLMRAKRERNRK